MRYRGEKVVTGAASGHLYVWFGRNCVRSLRGHHGPVTSMYSGPYGLISGGKVKILAMVVTGDIVRPPVRIVLAYAFFNPQLFVRIYCGRLCGKWHDRRYFSCATRKPPV